MADKPRPEAPNKTNSHAVQRPSLGKTLNQKLKDRGSKFKPNANDVKPYQAGLKIK